MIRILSLLAALVLGAGTAAHEGPHPEDRAGGPVLGRLEFPTSATVPAAQAAFIEGMLLLHLFEYEAARERFGAARALEPGFAMAHWGEAMTYNHPIWDEQDPEQARQALNRLAPNPQGRAAAAGSERERAWLAGLEILFGDGPKAARDRAYRRHLETMAERWPDDHEIRLFHALSLFGVHAGVRDIPDYLRAAALSQDVFSANPEHPGAAHYLIHGVDDPEHAILGLSAARALQRMAPDAPHAQHMASHIFLELGMWAELIATNRAAVSVGNRQRARRGLPPRRSGHYNYWLQYGLLQRGRSDEARAMLEAARAELAESGQPPPSPLDLDPDSSLTGSLVQMWARQIIETRDWHGELLEWQFDFGDSHDPPLNAAFVRALAGFLSGRSDDGHRWQAEFERLRTELLGRIDVQPEIPPQHHSYRERLHVLATELAAAERAANGDLDAALALAERASRHEGRMPTVFGPPFIDYPSAEFHGDLLRRAGRPSEAIGAYRLQLRRSQGKTLSLRGLLAAAEAIGDAEAAHEARTRLADLAPPD